MDGVPPPIRKVVSMAVWVYVDITNSCSSHTILLQLPLNHAIDGMNFYLFWDVSRLATLGLGLCDYIRVPDLAVLYLTTMRDAITYCNCDSLKCMNVLLFSTSVPCLYMTLGPHRRTYSTVPSNTFLVDHVSREPARQNNTQPDIGKPCRAEKARSNIQPDICRPCRAEKATSGD